MLLHFLLLFTVIAAITPEAGGVCVELDCVYGSCNAAGECGCFDGYTGIRCSLEKCGGGHCEEGFTCFSNGANCCSETECVLPNVAEHSQAVDTSKGTPVAMIVGLSFVGLMVVVMVGAVIIVKKSEPSGRGQHRYRYTGSTTARVQDPDNNKFIPAEDVTSIDNAAEVLKTWERTDSNALLEDPDYVVPYVPPSAASLIEKHIWEQPEQLQNNDEPVPPTGNEETTLNTKSPAADSDVDKPAPKDAAPKDAAQRKATTANNGSNKSPAANKSTKEKKGKPAAKK